MYNKIVVPPPIRVMDIVMIQIIMKVVSLIVVIVVVELVIV